ncbi:endonuclease/exonuclease/phosphatase family protein [Rhizobium sp. L1K21]|uniref:endonuclease/exonuclease/phosphatase family protein n=1 Tax=Rhizobium sp. L1K21 TaxID=2954933 RepID=UPI002093F296|nr:endonuclease/exonuclease/phosphatase family protein [Rhizobium sp. L1K21]MCO6185446.1 endonuclease/exonuclease/phosphatase family protein [Rhizobium sp. L1K21]
MHSAAILLFFSALRYVTGFWLFSFIYSFQTHISILVALVCVPFLIARKRPGLAIPLFIAAIGLGVHSLYLKGYFQPSPDIAAGTPEFHLLEFNVLGDNTEGAAEIAALLESADIDAAVILESGPLAPYLDRLSERFPYRLGCGEGTDTCDLMILSRYPLENTRVDNLSDLRRHRFARAELEIDGKRLTLVAAHLTKPYFDDYHTEELSVLGRRLSRLKGPLVLAGDFNSSILAPDMTRFVKHSGLNTFHGEPATWPVELDRFGIGIDHVFAREPLEVTSLVPLDDNYGSNHYGLRATIALTQN